MWIKWKYNDHGCGDFKELEIPDDLGGYESVEEYLCERDDLFIPTWSERFLMCRVKWEKLNLSEKEVNLRKARKLAASIAYHKKALERDEAELLMVNLG